MISDICDMLVSLNYLLFDSLKFKIVQFKSGLVGIVSFLIIPNMNFEPKKLAVDKKKKVMHIRALFNYLPQEDFFIPCKELGLGFRKGDILHIISQVFNFLLNLIKKINMR